MTSNQIAVARHRLNSKDRVRPLRPAMLFLNSNGDMPGVPFHNGGNL